MPLTPTQEGLQHLEHIEEELVAIKDRTGSTRRSFILGIFQGAGVVIGTILAVALLGWILSILGVIPGLGTLVSYLHTINEQIRSR
jgi:hypothetical protein